MTEYKAIINAAFQIGIEDESLSAYGSEAELYNAMRLALAAPDLLAACVQAYGDLIEGREVDIEKLDRAIAKAEGRS